MSAKQSVKLIREGQFAAEVEVELLEDETGWSPYLSLAAARKLDEVRAALKKQDIEAAARQARVYKLTPVLHAAE